jgi:uncharacterized membrane protein
MFLCCFSHPIGFDVYLVKQIQIYYYKSNLTAGVTPHRVNFFPFFSVNVHLFTVYLTTLSVAQIIKHQITQACKF